jgi:Holliday junction resolvase RusA-like endonuclease
MSNEFHDVQDVTITLRCERALTYTFELPWPKVLGNHATKHTRAGGHYKVPEAVAYDALVGQIVASMGMGRLTSQKPLAGPLSVSWLLAPPDSRARDVDNVRKVVADALTKSGFWKDDSCKVLVREAFEWTQPTPGGAVHLTVEVLA